MKHIVSSSVDIEEGLRREYEEGERAVSTVIRRVAAEIKRDWRDQIAGAGLGSPLSRAARYKTYPEGENSMNAALLVYTNSPQIISAHNNGGVIRSKKSTWLAFPLPAAGRGVGNARMTPAEYERRFGKVLRFVELKFGRAMLVLDDARLDKKGHARNKLGRRRKKDGILTGAQTVPIFLLVPQVRLTKRLNLLDSANKIAATIPAKIAATWED